MTRLKATTDSHLLGVPPAFVKVVRAETLVLGLLFLSLVWSPPARADGKEMHPRSDPEHMAAMRSVKEKIPEKYRQFEGVPLDASADNLATGRRLFASHCAVCHGEDGGGGGPAAAAMDPRPANFLDRSHSAMYGPGEKFWIITQGAAETGMPAFGDRLNESERWFLVSHILSLQRETEEE